MKKQILYMMMVVLSASFLAKAMEEEQEPFDLSDLSAEIEDVSSPAIAEYKNRLAQLENEKRNIIQYGASTQGLIQFSRKANDLYNDATNAGFTKIAIRVKIAHDQVSNLYMRPVQKPGRKLF